jgi:D-methionine transport system ATP-binding protein
MIRLNEITKTYTVGKKAVPALHGISLTVAQGEIFGVIGHSGAGKSTLIRCINLLERPTSGQVHVDGVELSALSDKQLQEERRKIGMIFQHFNLLSSATVAKNVAFPLELAGVSKEAIGQRVKELLELVGLEEHASKYPAQLSGGQKQRVGIARALANNPKVLLCDEATSALDPQTTNSILALLSDINRKLGLTIMLITHEMHVIRTICDKVAVIDGGRIVEEGPVTEVFLTPKHSTTREFVEQVSDSQELKEAIRHGKTSGQHRIVRITYLGETTYEPVLYEVTRQTGTPFAILQGTISRMKDTPYGQLTVQFGGTDADVARTLDSLKARGFDVEVL